MNPGHIALEREYRRILHEYADAPFEELSVMLDRQFTTLHARAHVLLVVCGLLVTGDAALSYQSKSASTPIVLLSLLGGGLAIAAAAVVLARVLRVLWITQFPGDTREEWLRFALYYRDQKTRAYRLAVIMLIMSMLVYEVLVADVLVSAAK
jgi:hypothetical protein